MLSRRQREVITIGNSIRITICRISGNVVRVGIEAPQDLKVLREEIDHLPPKEVPLAVA